MNQEQMRQRTMDFAVRIVRLGAALPAGRVGDVLGKQVLRAGTSIGANYREAIRASSRRQFATSLEIAQREADETLYWLDVIGASQLVKPKRLEPIRGECDELLSIITATIKTTKRRTTVQQNQKSEIRNQK